MLAIALTFLTPLFVLTVVDDALLRSSTSGVVTPWLRVRSVAQEGLFWAAALGLLFVVDLPAWRAMHRALRRSRGGGAAVDEEEALLRGLTEEEENTMTAREMLRRERALDALEADRKVQKQYERFVLFVGVAGYLLMYPRTTTASR